MTETPGWVSPKQSIDKELMYITNFTDMVQELMLSIYDSSKTQWKYRLGISLDDSPVEVYREVIVPSNIRLPHLSELLVRAVGWVGYHLTEFNVGDDFYVDSRSLREYKGWKMQERYHDYARFTLGQLIKKVDDTLTFTYDLGDDWQHTVRLLERGRFTGMNDPEFYLVDGRCSCPPDDVGGVHGYAEMLDLFDHPDDDPDQLQNYIEWLPEGFDPSRFDRHSCILRINDYLRTVRSFIE